MPATIYTPTHPYLPLIEISEGGACNGDTPMPIRHMIIHQIDKKPDGSPAILHLADQSLPESHACETLLQDFNNSYNAKQGKGLGLFHPESGAYPLCGMLAQYLAGAQTFVEFSREATEHLCKLLEEADLTTGGHVLFAQYQQGMTDYLTIGVMQQVETVSVDDQLRMISSRSLDAGTVTLAARINSSEWQSNAKSCQYMSIIEDKGGKKSSTTFATLSADKKASTARARRAPCSKLSPTLLK